MAVKPNGKVSVIDFTATFSSLSGGRLSIGGVPVCYPKMNRPGLVGGVVLRRGGTTRLAEPRGRTVLVSARQTDHDEREPRARRHAGQPPDPSGTADVLRLSQQPVDRRHRRGSQLIHRRARRRVTAPLTFLDPARITNPHRPDGLPPTAVRRVISKTTNTPESRTSRAGGRSSALAQ